MTVRSRLMATLALVTVVLAVPALFAASRLADLRDIAVEERGRHAAAALTLGRMEAALADLDRVERSYVATGDTLFRDAVRHHTDRLEDQLARLRSSRYGSAARALQPTVAALADRTREIETLMEAGALDLATDASLELEPLFVEMEAGLTALADSVDAVAQRDFDRAEAISSSALDATLVAVGVALLLTVLVGAWTTGALVRPLRRLVAGTAEVAAGSFEPPRDLPYGRLDEIGDLSRAFRTMTFRLQELDRMKTEFVGVASHELKNPVNVVRGYAELLEMGVAGELDPKQAEMVRAVDEQTRVMERLIGRLLDISRLESGTYELRVAPVETAELLGALRRAFGVLADKGDVRLVVEADPTAPDVLEVDAELLRDEVLGNLISNALEHTPAGGRVDVRALGRPGEVVFEVSDTGPGIPKEARHRIFQRYYRVDGRRKGGAGLGLALAREMVEAHGGRMELDPHASSGATFRVVLPRAGGALREPAIRRRGG